MSKREVIAPHKRDQRYARRDAQGQFTGNDGLAAAAIFIGASRNVRSDDGVGELPQGTTRWERLGIHNIDASAC